MSSNYLCFSDCENAISFMASCLMLVGMLSLVLYTVSRLKISVIIII